jgi:hypothetical protein
MDRSTRCSLPARKGAVFARMGGWGKVDPYNDPTTFAMNNDPLLMAAGVYLDVLGGDMNGVNYDDCSNVKFRRFCRSRCYDSHYYNSSTLYYCDIDNVLKPVKEYSYADGTGIPHNNDGGGVGYAFVGAPESNLQFKDMVPVNHTVCLPRKCDTATRPQALDESVVDNCTYPLDTANDVMARVFDSRGAVSKYKKGDLTTATAEAHDANGVESFSWPISPYHAPGGEPTVVNSGVGPGAQITYDYLAVPWEHPHFEQHGATYGASRRRLESQDAPTAADTPAAGENAALDSLY